MSKEFYARLATIQHALNAPKGQYNNFGKYHYRSCEDILEGVKPLLDGLFLSISDEIVLIGDRYYVKSTATITDGETSHSATAMAREALDKKGMDEAQITGATSSYARKYCLNGLFGIDDSKDADSNEHKQQQNNSKPQQQQQKPKPAPDAALAAFTEAAMKKATLEELKQAFAKAWQMLDGTPEQAKAKEVYEIRKSELEGAAA
jgi:hypothetical protein